MMKRSHNRKPLRMLLGSTVATRSGGPGAVRTENEIMIEGSAGTGFVQDTSCYHRARRRPRRSADARGPFQLMR